MPSLKVDVVSAKTSSKGDFVCNVTCGKSKQKTKVAKKTNTPEWNESFTLPVDEGESLKIELVEAKSLGSKTLGTMSISLAGLTKGQLTSKTETFSDKSELKVNVTAVDFGRAAATVAPVDSKPKDMLSAMLPPMPSEAEVNRMYNELMEQLGIGKGFKHPTSYQTKQMAELSLENKWALLCQNKTIEVQKSQGKIEDTPQYWTNRVRDGPNLKLLRDLRIVLGGESLPWLQNFIESGGLVNLLEILSSIEQNIHRRSMSQLVTKEDEQVEMQLETVRCLQTLMNNKTGLSGAINTENGVRTLTLCLDMPHEDVRLRISKILTVVCLMPPDGHRLVIDAMTAFKTLKKEKYRFENLLIQLATAQSLEAKTVLLTFINALVNSPTDIDLRVSLRNEFQKGGLDDIIKNLKEKLNPELETDLETQIDVYDEESNLDYKELKERFDSYNININDTDAVFKTLKEQVNQAGLGSNFLHALQNLLIIPVMTDKGSKSFLLACRVLRQISLNKDRIGSGEDANGGVNFSDLLVSVESEFKEVPLNKKIDELTLEINNLIKKCQTLDIELKEKEDKINSLRAELKSGGGGGGSSIVSSGSTSGETVFDGPPPPPLPGSGPPPPPDSFDGPPPPPPPGFDGPPPPPPPGFDGPPPPPGFDGPPPPPLPGGPPPPPGMGMPAKVIKKKPRKTPQSKMKGLQWTKLPPNKMKGTIFEKFALEYKGIDIDYKELEESFSAKIIEKKEEEKKPQVVSILDPKTTQNISIFLSQFKNNSNEELVRELVAMNLKAFTAEHIKQITQFLPSKDDMTNIEQYIQGGGDMSKLGPADKFALELSKVPQLAQILQAFAFRLGFEPKKSDIKPDIDLLKTASKEVLSSKKFPQIVELILEIGNFINEGTPRGGITAFKFGSLLKLADTKTTDNTASLVQYLVTLLQKRAPELLTFGSELSHAEKAARVSIQQLTSDVATLQKEFNTVQSIAETFPDQQAPFVVSIRSFLNKVKDDLEQISKGFKSMEDSYAEATGLFGEIPKDMGPEEFFGTISKFIECIAEAEKLNQKAAEDAVKAKRREEAKVKREQDIAAKKTGTSEGHDSVVEELFGALKGGNVFKNRRVQQNNPGAAPAPAQPQQFQLPTLRKTNAAPTKQ